MKPMTFTEFLLANGDASLVDYLNSIDSISPIPAAFLNPLEEKLKMYFVTGGMPESVRMWTENRDVNQVQKFLRNILDAYERDFSKHAELKDFPKISMIWGSIPSQLARENKKFLYSAVKEGARAREYEDALQWLCDSELVYKTYRSTKPGLPISEYDDLGAFKLYLCDVGLLRRLSLLAPSAFSEGNRLFKEFKGALSENYILQGLSKIYEAHPRYWTDGKGQAEIDFLIQHENDILPIEVKADENIESASLKKYAARFKEDAKLRVRFSMRNLKKDENMLNIPLFTVDYTEKLINVSLKN